MGSLILPMSGLVYADAQITIYSADGHALYAPVCRPLWQPGPITVVTSELTLAEVLVGPLRLGDAVLAARRENLWRQPNTRMLPITEDILREAVRLRATIPCPQNPGRYSRGHCAVARLCALCHQRHRFSACSQLLPCHS
jgi:hypothetical protein